MIITAHAHIRLQKHVTIEMTRKRSVEPFTLMARPHVLNFTADLAAKPVCAGKSVLMDMKAVHLASP